MPEAVAVKEAVAYAVPYGPFAVVAAVLGVCIAALVTFIIRREKEHAADMAGEADKRAALVERVIGMLATLTELTKAVQDITRAVHELEAERKRR